MIKLSSALAALAMAAACATTPNSDPMKRGLQLMAEMKAATGGTKLDALTTYHASGKRVRDGRINGTFDEWGDMRTTANATRETFEGVTVSSGYDGKVGWSVGPDGAVDIESDPERLGWTRLGAYVNSQGYLFPERFPASFEFRGREEADGKSYDVVTVTPDGAASVDIWLDPDTYLLARLVASNGPGKLGLLIQDYRTVDGVKVVRHALQTLQTGDQTHTETQDIVSYKFESVPADRFSPPR